MMRLYELFVALICIVLGSLSTYAGLAMTAGMLLYPDTKMKQLFWVGVVALIVAPIIVVAGIRLLLNMPNQRGGLLSAFALRSLAVINGILGGIILVLAYREGDFQGIVGGIGFLVTTQGAFALANARAAT
jgi:hypothetical protein